jgi:hypothetical protein
MILHSKEKLLEALVRTVEEIKCKLPIWRNKINF